MSQKILGRGRVLLFHTPDRPVQLSDFNFQISVSPISRGTAVLFASGSVDSFPVLNIETNS